MMHHVNKKKNSGVFNKLINCDWTLIWSKIKSMKSYRSECDDGQGILNVVSSLDGDMHLFLTPHSRADDPYSQSFRARTWCGGGRNERTRVALMLLAIAIQEDEELDDYEY